MTPPNRDALFDVDPALEATNAGVEARRRRAAALEVERVLGPGPVYQGVSLEIRRLTAKGARFADVAPAIDATEHAGTIAAARALARAIDKATGHNVTGWHANGRDVSPMFEELRELLSRLHPDGQTVDAFEAWLTDDSAPAEDVPQ
jgi:hypothetical protein